MRASARLLVVLLATAGCGFEGTVAVVKLDGSLSEPIASIELTPTLGGQSVTVTLQEKGGTITLPTSAALQFKDGDHGALDVLAIAKNQGGEEVGRGTKGGMLVSGHTVTIEITLVGQGPPGDDGGLDGPTDLPAVPMLAADSSTHDFGIATTGTSSATFSVIFSNVGGAATGSLTTALTGTGANAFQLVNDGCTTKTLAPGESCTVKAKFQPAAAGSQAASLDVGDGTAMAAVTLSGQGVAPGLLTLMPDTQDFGAVVKNSTSSPVTFTVKNTGGATSGTLVTALSGTDLDQFTVQNDTCAGTTLAPSATCTLDALMSPTTLGSKSISLTVTGTPGGTAVSALSGVSISAAKLAFTTGAGFDFNTVDVSSGTSMQAVTVKNIGGQSSGVITTTIPTSADFSVVDGCNGNTVASNDTCTITVTFAPATFGPKSLDISVDATPGGMIQTTLNGTGRDYVTLTIQTNGGAGTGSVTSMDGKISCGATCTAQYPRTSSSYSTVALSAMADTSSDFAGWSPASCPGTGGCNVTMDTNHTVVATFDVKTFVFTISVGGINGVTGTVTSSDSVFNCTGNCSHTYDYSSSPITLTPVATGGGNKFLGWGGDCHGLQACSLASNAPHQVTAQFGSNAVNYMFLTSTTMAPPLGATASAVLTNADAFCQARATAAGLGGTTWLAFLATSLGDGYGRLTASGKNGWVRTDGFPFTDTAASLKPFTGKVFYPPRLDEFGNDIGTDPTNFLAATGQFPLGIATGYTCNDWSSNLVSDSAWAGAPTSGSYGWHSRQPVSCDKNVRLYCFQADGSSTVSPPSFNAGSQRIIWVSDTAAAPTSGGSVTSFDTICQNEASTNGLAGPFTNYIALLPPSTMLSAITRFDTSAGAHPWARIDGTVVAGPTDLGLGVLTAPIQVSLTADYQGTTPSIWTNGTANPAATGMYDCNDWASNINSVYGGQGDMTRTEPSWWLGTGGIQTCNTSLRFICAHN